MNATATLAYRMMPDCIQIYCENHSAETRQQLLVRLPAAPCHVNTYMHDLANDFDAPLPTDGCVLHRHRGWSASDPDAFAHCQHF